jgi:predicted glutamine amidotransferase
MCRLFGFRSVIRNQVHHSLLDAENALQYQSVDHPDGWGVAYYLAGAPHIIKSERSALNDHIFKQVSGVVYSETVMAHIRNATKGSCNILNTHPFQFGNWVFAHNGNIKDFKKYKKKLLMEIKPELRRFVLGETDSELIFYSLLSDLSEKIELEKKYCPIDLLSESVKETIGRICDYIGPFLEDDTGENTETYLSFILTNGKTMIAHQGGKDLYYSTYKNKCPERETCASFSPECENPPHSGIVNHLIFSSTKLAGDNIWTKMTPGQLVGTDELMKIHIKK